MPASKFSTATTIPFCLLPEAEHQRPLPAWVVVFLTPGLLHALSAWPLWACGFVDRAIPNSSVGVHSYYFPEGSHNSGHLLSMRIKGQGVLMKVNSGRYLGVFGTHPFSSLSHPAASHSRTLWWVLRLYLGWSAFVCLTSSAHTPLWPVASCGCPGHSRSCLLIMHPVPQDSHLKV